MPNQRFAAGDLVMWHEEERSYEGRVVGQRTLKSGAVIVYVKTPSVALGKAAVYADRLAVIETAADRPPWEE